MSVQSGEERAFFDRQQRRRREAQFAISATSGGHRGASPVQSLGTRSRPEAAASPEDAVEPVEAHETVPPQQPVPPGVSRPEGPEPEEVLSLRHRAGRISELVHHLEHHGDPTPEEATHRSAPEPSISDPTIRVTPADLAASPRVRVIVTAGVGTGEEFAVPPGELLIGRRAGAAIRLSDPTVSHDHAILRVGSDTVTIEALPSKNGTKVNRKLITPGLEIPLLPGDEVAVAEVHFVVKPLRP